MVDVVEKSFVIDDEEKRTALATTGRVSVLKAIAILLLVLVPPALIRPTAQGKLNFDAPLLAQVNAVSPDYVFIGNSMLNSRIDEATLEKRLGRHCCFILWTGGAESAWTHQALKNIALAADHRPKKVFIFFRDAYLTQPTYRATDRYWWKIERLSHANEPEFDWAMTADRTWQEQLAYRIGDLYPIEKARDRAGAAVSWLASEIATPGRVRYGASAGQKYEGLFDLDKLRSVPVDDTAFEEEDLSEYDFDAQVGTSLLPSMIKLAKDAGVGLVFVRVQRRPTLQGPPAQRPELQDYMKKFGAYASARGAELYDFTGDPELTVDHYLDGDHISAAWKPESTDLFLRRLQRSFQ
ncbi:MAG: hypothetical protein QOD56_1731 [Gammaproteobacteria bacterium]|nr:hypothetical protein [Gammaproteobacteria bacterium]